MSMRDLDQIDRDELTIGKRFDRDVEREPRHRHPRCVAPHPEVKSYEATMRLSCPVCSGAVYVPRDSHLDAITCADCTAPLLTRRTIDGVDLVERERQTGCEP